MVRDPLPPASGQLAVDERVEVASMAQVGEPHHAHGNPAAG
jgi:hypothetical protein